MNNKFESKESYKHKLAKQVLKEWLDNNHELQPFPYSDNGWVILEYPICIFSENNPKSPGRDDSWEYDVFTNYGNPIPSYTECIQEYDTHPIAMIDIVVVHKGHPLYAIEICHTNPVSNEKLMKLKDLGVTNLYEVKADWILNQTGIPDTIKCIQLID